MNMQKMIAEAQKMQRQMEKAQQELAHKTFRVCQNDAVTVEMLGSREMVSIEIDPDLFNAEDREMVQDMLKMAINEALGQIDAENEKIQAIATGGFGF